MMVFTGSSSSTSIVASKTVLSRSYVAVGDLLVPSPKSVSTPKISFPLS